MSSIINSINTIISSFSVDAVAIYDQNFNQLFTNARPLKATIKETAKVMQHPLETGATITDHRVILPIEIELSLIAFSSDYKNVYSSIRQYYLNSTLVVIQTRTGVYQNQLISEMPHEESTEQYDTLVLALKLKEAQFANTQSQVIPKNPSNGGNTNRGNIQPVTPTQGQGSSILHDIFGGII